MLDAEYLRQSMRLRKDLKLASFDATGPECLFQLEGMLNVMDRLRAKLYPNEPERVMFPCEYFELMGGSGSGGLIVLFLARLRMSVEEAISELAHIVDKVYSDHHLTAEDQASLLKELIEDVLRKRGLPIDLKLKAEEGNEKCGGFVLASARIGLGDIVCLRSYDVKRYPSSPITVVDAALATWVVHRLDSVATVDKRQGYIGPGLEGSNPVRTVLREATLRYGGDSSVALLLSLGAIQHNYAEGPILDQKPLPALLEAALAHNEAVAQQMHDLLDRIGFYYRIPTSQKTDGNFSPGAETEKCVESLMAKDGAITLDLLYSLWMRELCDEPPMTPHFVPRKDSQHILRTAIDQEHSRRKVIVVSGEAGCGKTQLVRRLVEDHDCSSRFRHIVWTNATSEKSIKGDIIKEAGVRPTLSLPAPTINPLVSLDNSLVVYSNANDPDLDLSSLFPKGDGVIIVTTTNEQFSSLASEPNLHIKIDTMTEVEAVDVIHWSANRESSSNEGRIAAAAIAEKLHYLPLALAQAGSYISEIGCLNAEYLALLEHHLCQSAEQQDPVFTTCTINFHRMPQNTQRFLQLLSMLESSNFPLATIPHAAKHEFRHDAIPFIRRGQELEAPVQLLTETFLCDGGWSDRVVSEMALTLEKYSLASFTLTTDTILVRIHPVVRNWVFSQISTDKLVVFRDAACRLVAVSVGEPQLERHLPVHIDALMQLRTLGPIHLNEMAAFGTILVNLERRQQARPLWADVHKDLREIYGTQHLHVATAALKLGGTYDSETLDLMEKFEKEAIGIRETLLGPQHLDTLWAKVALAGTFGQQKRGKECAQLSEEVIPVLKLQFSPADPVVLMATFLLALYRLDPDSGEACDPSSELWSQLLDECRAYYGRTHPTALAALEILALAAVCEGSFADADKRQLEMLEILNKQLGETHITTLHYMDHLGGFYSNEEKYTQSEHLYKKAMEGFKQQLGNTHDDTVQVMGSLASLYELQKRYAEAESLRLEILEVKTGRVGEDDVGMFECMAALANNYYVQKLYPEAANLAEKVSERYETLYGLADAKTLRAIHILSIAYQDQGRLADAENSQLREIKGWGAQSGPKHPNFYIIMANLACMYSSQGRYSEAEALMVKAAEGIRVCRGDSHPETIRAMKNLANTYGNLHRHVDAANLRAMVLKVHEASVGGEHQDTKTSVVELLTSYVRMPALNALAGIKQHFGEKNLQSLVTQLMRNLAILYSKRNKPSEAAIVEAELIKVYTDMGKTLKAAIASSTLARLYYKMGRLEEAEKLAMEAARVIFRLSGEKDPQYQETISLLEEIRQPTLSSAFTSIKRAFSSRGSFLLFRF